MLSQLIVGDCNYGKICGDGQKEKAEPIAPLVFNHWGYEFWLRSANFSSPRTNPIAKHIITMESTNWEG